MENEKPEFALFGHDLFGDAIQKKKSGPLSERFEFTPFSVLDARQGEWQERKRAWLSVGIQSELGRGAPIGGGEASTGSRHEVCDGRTDGIATPRRIDVVEFGSDEAQNIELLPRTKANATPGGSLMPSCNYSKNKSRGDGRGRPI